MLWRKIYSLKIFIKCDFAWKYCRKEHKHEKTSVNGKKTDEDIVLTLIRLETYYFWIFLIFMFEYSLLIKIPEKEIDF